jgi:hypothetical protein
MTDDTLREPPDLRALIEGAALSRVLVSYSDADDSPVDRSAILTASEAATCLRQVWYRKSAEGPSRGNWGPQERGHAVEAWIVDLIERALPPPARLTRHGWLQRTLIDVTHAIGGTPDGVLVFPNPAGEPVRWLIEIKSVDPRKNYRAMTEPDPAHEAQVQVNLALLALRGERCEGALVLYVDASDFSQMVQFVVRPDARPFNEAAARARRLFAAEDAADLPAEGLLYPDGCKWCAFTARCAEVQAAKGGATPKPAGPMPVFEARGIGSRLQKLADKKARRAQLDDEIAELETEVKEAMTAKEVTRWASGGYVATLTPVAGRKTLDTARYIEAAGVDPAPFYKTGAPSLRLKVEAVDQENREQGDDAK